MRWSAVTVVLFALWCGEAPVAAQMTPVEVTMTYLRQAGDEIVPLSLVEPLIDDEGLAGARLGLTDNQTTGRFLQHQYSLNERIVAEDGDLAAVMQEALDAGERLFVANLMIEDLQAITPLAEEAGALVFNTRAQDTSLRDAACSAAVFHVMPSRAMKADALAQYLRWKNWDEAYLVHGALDDDKAFAAALERAFTKFNLDLVGTKQYDYVEQARRADGGHTLVQQQLPVFMQEAPAHDVVMVADESEVFGEYLAYRTWTPRPVVGTQGLVPSAWHRSSEQWGGTQLQRRFEDAAGRPMRERDHTAWLAVRSIGEAVTRTSSGDPTTLRDYLRSDAFEIAAFKGVPLSFRLWNQQMRQPILLTTQRMLVTVSPQEGFLHQGSELDTLGLDQPESACALS